MAHMSESLATPMLAKVGLSFGDIEDYARKCLEVVKTAGDTTLDLMAQGWKLWSAFTSRDLSGIIAAFTAAERDVEAIYAAIKAAFNL